MREKILNDLLLAMKEKNKDLLSVLRMVKGAMQLEEINLKRELNDEEVIQIISKQIKSRKESIVEFEKGNREDLISQAKNEIAILEEYLPEQLSQEEIEKVINDVFENVKPTGKSDMGKIMKEIMPLVKGKADMSVVNEMIKERLDKVS